MTQVSVEDVGIAVLVDAARNAARNAYAPYSRFAVGAALLLTDGQIVTGTNFENASYGLSLCAETVALATVNGIGRLHDVLALAVVGGPIGTDGRPEGNTPVGPCGRCRQVINEAAEVGGRDIPVFCASADGQIVRRYAVSELLPFAFGPKDLAPSL